jgi:hypothetical protein
MVSLLKEVFVDARRQRARCLPGFIGGRGATCSGLSWSTPGEAELALVFVNASQARFFSFLPDRRLFSVANGKYRATAAATSRLLAVVLFCGTGKLRRRLVEGETKVWSESK